MLRKRAARRLIRGISADLTRTWMVSRELFWSSSVFTHSSRRQVILPRIVSLYAVHKHKSVHTLTDVQIHTQLQNNTLFCNEIMHLDLQTSGHAPTKPLR